MGTPPQTEITSLVSLITGAVHTIESYYKAHGEEAPSLDKTQAHPLDNVPYPSDIRHAVQTLEGACVQLCATLARPDHTILNHFMSLQQPTSLGVVLRSKIADVLLDEPSGMPVTEISKRTGIEQRKLGRVLRLLCSQHIFKEVSKDIFANNRLSMQLLASNPLSSFGIHSTAEPIPQIASCLADTLLDPKYGHSYAAADSAFNRSFGYKAPLYVYYEDKDHEKAAILGARFGRGMTGWNSVTEVDRVITDFPWAELPKNTIVNDVGGGLGDISMKLCKQYPNLVFKLQDLPERIRQAQNEVWPAQCPEAITDGRIEFKAFNMLHSPPVPNCDIYFVKHIIHCFPDDAAIVILKNIVKAMSPNSRLLIYDCFIQGAYRVPDNESEYTQAPVPLLPNFGAGRIRQYTLDLLLMESHNGEQRTLDGCTKLAEAAGLRFVKFWDLGELDIAEFALVTLLT